MLTRRLRLLLLVLTGLSVVGSSFVAFGQEKEGLAPDITFEEGQFSPSRVCATCHFQIFQNWKRSLHAQAVEDPIFSLAYMEAYRATAGEVKTLCLRCHAPIVQLTGDFDLKEGISAEGITCDFCHSVKGVTLGPDGNRAYQLEVGRIKRGPWEDSSSPVHETAYSPLHTEAEFCAGCHEYVSPSGAHLLSTFTEWSSSPYAAEGVVCQGCHMPRISGEVVRPGVASVQRQFINLHEVKGGHSVEQLKKAVEVRLQEVGREGDRLQVEVEVENVGAGHMVPTGWPRKKLTLVVQAITAAGQTFRKERTYQKVLADETGQPIERDSEVFQRSAILLIDNRLAPRETKRETFEFSVPRGTRVVVKASVFYEYEPLLARPYPIQVELSGQEAFLEGE